MTTMKKSFSDSSISYHYANTTVDTTMQHKNTECTSMDNFNETDDNFIPISKYSNIELYEKYEENTENTEEIGIEIYKILYNINWTDVIKETSFYTTLINTYFLHKNKREILRKHYSDDISTSIFNFVDKMIIMSDSNITHMMTYVQGLFDGIIVSQKYENIEEMMLMNDKYCEYYSNKMKSLN